MSTRTCRVTAVAAIPEHNFEPRDRFPLALVPQETDRNGAGSRDGVTPVARSARTRLTSRGRRLVALLYVTAGTLAFWLGCWGLAGWSWYGSAS